MSDPASLLSAPFDAGDAPPPERGRLAVLRARPGLPFAPEAAVCEQGFKPMHDALAAEGRKVLPRLPDDAPPFDAAATLATRSRDETRAGFARAWAMTRPGGTVIAAGSKTDGIESLQRELRGLIELAGVRPGGHGRAVWATRTEGAR